MNEAAANSRFRVEIPDEMVLHHPSRQWARMVAFIDSLDPDGRYLEGHQSYIARTWTYKDEGPTALATVLQAAARGHDLKAVLDALGAPAAPFSNPYVRRATP